MKQKKGARKRTLSSVMQRLAAELAKLNNNDLDRRFVKDTPMEAGDERLKVYREVYRKRKLDPPSARQRTTPFF